MTDLLSPVADALITRLAADSALQAMLGNPARVHDQRPAMATFPFVVLGESEGRDASTKSLQLSSQLITLHVFSRQRSGQEARRILAAIHDCLHDSALTLASGQLARCQEELISVMHDRDSDGSHGLARYRLVISA